MQRLKVVCMERGGGGGGGVHGERRRRRRRALMGCCACRQNVFYTECVLYAIGRKIRE